MIVLTPIPRDRLEDMWPRIVGLLARAYEATDAAFDADYLLGEGKGGWRQFWTITDGEDLLAALETRVIGKRIVVNALAGRNMRAWLRAAERQLTDIAAAHGLTSIECDGRRGWQRMLPEYRIARVTLRKDLRHVE